MAYSGTTWKNGVTALSDTNMNKIEKGLEATNSYLKLNKKGTSYVSLVSGDANTSVKVCRPIYYGWAGPATKSIAAGGAVAVTYTVSDAESGVKKLIGCIGLDVGSSQMCSITGFGINSHDETYIDQNTCYAEVVNRTSSTQKITIYWKILYYLAEDIT